MAGVVTTVALLAHQGGWDEVLLVGGPILVIVAVLWVAKRRVDAAAAQLGTNDQPSDDQPSDDQPSDGAPSEAGDTVDRER